MYHIIFETTNYMILIKYIYIVEQYETVWLWRMAAASSAKMLVRYAPS